MLQATQISAAALGAMRERAVLATAEFYAKIGRPAPVNEPRFQAVTKGNMWHIIDLKTGKTCGFCGSYRLAQHVANAMEAAAKRKLMGRP